MSTLQVSKINSISGHLVFVCPYCDAKVFRSELNTADIDFDSITNLPFAYKYICPSEKCKKMENVFLLYLDRQFTMRGYEKI